MTGKLIGILLFFTLLFVRNMEAEDLPPDAVAGLKESQKATLTEAVKGTACPCGCPMSSVFECRIKDPDCSVSKGLVAQAAELAKQGKSVEEIRQALNSNRESALESTIKVVLVPYRADDPAVGPNFAKVTIVEFSDFQCPHCSEVDPVIKKVIATYPQDVRLIYKHQPLKNHEHAMEAAEAAEAAREQGKFWEMHDVLFKNQEHLGPTKYAVWAKQIGLNVADFKQSMKEHRNQDRIREDARLEDATGQRGTPMFFINGRPVVGAATFEEFKTMIDEEIGKANDLMTKGIALDADFYHKIVELNLQSMPQPQTQTN
jgi:protein-disulfide isomerase